MEKIQNEIQESQQQQVQEEKQNTENENILNNQEKQQSFESFKESQEQRQIQQLEEEIKKMEEEQKLQKQIIIQQQQIKIEEKQQLKQQDTQTQQQQQEQNIIQEQKQNDIEQIKQEQQKLFSQLENKFSDKIKNQEETQNQLQEQIHKQNLENLQLSEIKHIDHNIISSRSMDKNTGSLLNSVNNIKNQDTLQSEEEEDEQLKEYFKQEDNQQQQDEQEEDEEEEEEEYDDENDEEYDDEDDDEEYEESYKKIFDDEEVKKYAKDIKVSWIGTSGILDYQSILNIFEQSIQLASKQYKIMINENRLKRREILKNQNHQEYIDFIVNHSQEVENLIDVSQYQILDYLEIDKTSQFEESQLMLLEKGMQEEILSLQASVRQRLKNSIENTKIVDQKQLEEIIQLQIDKFEKKDKLLMYAIEELSQTDDSQQIIPFAVNIILSDIIFEKYQIEEEDQIKSLSQPGIQQNQKLQKLLQKIDHSINELIIVNTECGDIMDD